MGTQAQETRGTVTIRGQAQKLYHHDPAARDKFKANLKTLIQTSPLSFEALARECRSSEAIVTKAASGFSIEYDDAVKLARHFKVRVLTLLTEDVASRVLR